MIFRARLLPCVDRLLPERLARSAGTTDAGCRMRTADFAAWLARRARAHAFHLCSIPFAELGG